MTGYRRARLHTQEEQSGFRCGHRRSPYLTVGFCLTSIHGLVPDGHWTSPRLLLNIFMDRINWGPHFVDAVLHFASSGGDLKDCLTADCEAAEMRNTTSKSERRGRTVLLHGAQCRTEGADEVMNSGGTQSRATNPSHPKEPS